MIEAAMIWNEPNNKSHWDPAIDPEWAMFAEHVIRAGAAIGDAGDGLAQQGKAEGAAVARREGAAAGAVELLLALVAVDPLGDADHGDHGEIKFHSDPFMCMCNMLRQRKSMD